MKQKRYHTVGIHDAEFRFVKSEANRLDVPRTWVIRKAIEAYRRENAKGPRIEVRA